MAIKNMTGRKRVALEHVGSPGCRVYVAGTFNHWAPREKRMKPVDGVGRYKAWLFLHPGRYEYKFLVNDEWHIDSANPFWAPNGCGSLNSVLTVDGATERADAEGPRDS